MMKERSDRFSRVIDLLKKSEPRLDSADVVEENVIKRIKETSGSGLRVSDVIDFIFGWTYIGWMRKSLATVAFLLVVVFVFQQVIILKEINSLGKQFIITDKMMYNEPGGDLKQLLMIYRSSGNRFPDRELEIPAEQKEEVDEFIESVLEMQDEYRELLQLIEEDKELKEFIEKRLDDNNKKIKI
jgi:hypothetical protein